MAQALIGEGARVALVARRREGLDRAVALLDASRGQSLALVADTSDDQSVRAMVRKAEQDMGGVDILVNAAARPAGGPVPALVELSDDAVRVEFETKVLGYLRCFANRRG